MFLSTIYVYLLKFYLLHSQVPIYLHLIFIGHNILKLLFKLFTQLILNSFCQLIKNLVHSGDKSLQVEIGNKFS